MQVQIPLLVSSECRNATPLFRANVILLIVKGLNQIGSPTERLLKQFGLSVKVLDDLEALIPPDSVFSFLERTAQSEGIAHLRVLMSQQAQIADFEMFGKILHQSLTLYDLMHTVSALLTTTYIPAHEPG